MTASIISVCFVILALVSLLPGILKARKLYWVEAISRIIIVLASASLTILFTALLAMPITNLLVKPIEAILSNTNIDDILRDVTSAEGAFAIVLSIIVTPLLFIGFFLLIKWLLNLAFARLLTKGFLAIAGAIKKKDYISDVYPKAEEKAEETTVAEDQTTSEENNEQEITKPHYSVRSAIFGALCGLLSFIVLFIPVVGTFATVSSIGTSATHEGTFYDVSEGLSENIATKLMLPITSPIWSAFSHYYVNEEEINIVDEAHLVGVLIEAFGEMSSDDVDTVHHSAQLFRELSELCPNTSLVPCVCADFINAARPHWLEGKDFDGVMMPSLVPGSESTDSDNEKTTSDDVVESLIVCLESSTTETMREDLAAIANAMAIIAENAIVSEDGAIDMNTVFEDEKVISKLSVVLLNNERLSPVMANLTKKSNESSGQIELPEKEDEQYQNIVSSFTGQYYENVGDTITEESLENLAAAVGTTLEQEAGVILAENEKMAIASSFISEFGTEANLTEEMVSSFIEQYRKEQQG